MEINDNVPGDRWVSDKMSTLDPGSDWQPNAARGLAMLRARRSARRRRSRRWTWAVVAVVAVSLALPVTRAFAARCVEACVGVTSRVSQFFLPDQPAGARSQAIIEQQMRVPAPDFTLDDAVGRRLQLSSLRGKVVLLNFWATWCPPCKIEIPWFAEFTRRYGDQHLAVIGVSLDEDGWASVRPYAEHNKINYSLAIVNDEISGAYGGVGTLPATFLIDRQGRVAAKHVGIVARSEYETEIARLLAEK
jgi:peroxiredoxin